MKVKQLGLVLLIALFTLSFTTVDWVQASQTDAVNVSIQKESIEDTSSDLSGNYDVYNVTSLLSEANANGEVTDQQDLRTWLETTAKEIELKQKPLQTVPVDANGMGRFSLLPSLQGVDQSYLIVDTLYGLSEGAEGHTVSQPMLVSFPVVDPITHQLLTEVELHTKDSLIDKTPPKKGDDPDKVEKENKKEKPTRLPKTGEKNTYLFGMTGCLLVISIFLLKRGTSNKKITKYLIGRK